MTPAVDAAALPTHKDLPETDGLPVINFHETPQTTLLNGSMRPRLERLFPDGQFLVGNDNGIYWLPSDPPLRGCKAPDWFVVIGVPPMLDGGWRRSYVLWQEKVTPLIVIEYVSTDGAEEHDRTPDTGKFWVYENGIKARHYAIVDGLRGTLQLYRNDGAGYHAVPATAGGRLPVPELGVELGLWRGTLMGTTAWYVRPWDITTGVMLPSWHDDRAALPVERERANAAERLVDDMKSEVEEGAEQARQARELAAARAEDARQAREAATAEAEAARQAREQARQARRAEDLAQQEADRQRQEAEQALQKAARLAEKLRQLGIDPEAA